MSSRQQCCSGGSLAWPRLCWVEVAVEVLEFVADSVCAEGVRASEAAALVSFCACFDQMGMLLIASRSTLVSLFL